MKMWSSRWVGSKKPKKQRKYRYNAPLHVKRKFLVSPLSKDLRKKYGIKNISVRSGDKVKLMRGNSKKLSGTVAKVSLKRSKLYIDGIENIKKDGSKSFYPIDPSNVQITELNLEDKKRKKSLERKGVNQDGK